MSSLDLTLCVLICYPWWRLIQHARTATFQRQDSWCKPNSNGLKSTLRNNLKDSKFPRSMSPDSPSWFYASCRSKLNTVWQNCAEALSVSRIWQCSRMVPFLLPIVTGVWLLYCNIPVSTATLRQLATQYTGSGVQCLWLRTEGREIGCVSV